MTMAILTSLIAVVIVLGIMILVHEWGHFIVARLCGVRVEIFSFGFGPRLWGRKRGATDYRLSALPLGGYVKMAGDNPSEERAGEPDEFLSRPRWQRALIVLAGPTMNLLTTVLLYAGIFYFAGLPMDAYMLRPVELAGVLKNSPAAAAGLQVGDRIVGLNELQNPTWEQAQTAVVRLQPGSELRLQVERGGESLAVNVPVNDPRQIEGVLGYPKMPAIVDQVQLGMPAERAGLQAGDQILELNGQMVQTWYQVSEAIRGSNGKPLQIVVQRGDRQLHLQVKAVQVQGRGGEMVWQIGMLNRGERIYRRLGLVDSVEYGALNSWGLGRQIVGIVGQLFTGTVSIRQLQGVIGITREAGQAVKRGPVDFVNLMAVISLNLGILNLLPIPILDGGHILMLSVEGVIRRDLSVTVKERFVQVGMVFLLIILAIVMYNDVLRFFPGR